MSGWSHGYLGIISTFFRVNMSSSRTEHGAPSEDQTPTLSLTTKTIRNFRSFQLNVCTTSVTEGEVAGVKLV